MIFTDLYIWKLSSSLAPTCAHVQQLSHWRSCTMGRPQDPLFVYQLGRMLEIVKNPSDRW